MRWKFVKQVERSQLGWFGLYLIPAAGVFWFVTHLGVDVPVWADQWALVNFFKAAAAGDIGAFLGELWKPNNDHRMVFPKLIFLGLAFLSNWNIKFELYFSFFLACLSAISLYFISRKTHQNQSHLIFHLATLISIALIFSWVQYRNWLWGFQLALFLINFCVIATALVFTLRNPPTKSQITLAALLCGIASFSSAQGLMSWPALLPAIVNLEQNFRQKIKSVLIWILLFLASGWLYSLNYSRYVLDSDFAPPIYTSLWERIWYSAHFFLNVAAAPLADFSAGAWILGAIFIAGYVLLFFRNFDRDRLEFESDAVPWLCLGLFSLFCMALITVGRASLGPDYALSTSRFTTHSILLPIALINLLVPHLPSRQSDVKKWQKSAHLTLIYGFFMGVILNSTLARSLDSLELARWQISEPTRVSKSCFYLIDYLELETSTFLQETPGNCLAIIAPKPVGLLAQVENLRSIDLRDFSTTLSFVDNPEKLYGFIDRIGTQKSGFSFPPDGIVQLSGWAIFPEGGRQPDLVLFSTGDRRSFFAATFVNLDSPDIAEEFNSNRYRRSRWTLHFPADSLTAGDHQIKAWVYDPETETVFRLAGEMPVTVRQK
ncbi:hypothetical protein [Lyngbya sp. CCY1209]|uniref:hypothetical protein n=1 Tax=Lyngbya sp. CCY1209 TaxID=2886103 RepID=UPI002D20EFF2|nr:hypothetical protein [Lyngbya sp. CCY1209]MEB3882796.1 hypothetical protein [Lyngbya sp. CCY1209]